MIATFFFNFSPLAIYYEREVLLDNIMVFWVLLSIYLLLRRETRVFTGMWSGLAFGISVVSKENAIFFAPTIFYLLAHRTKGDPDRRFAMMLWLVAASAPVAFYVLFATLKGELFPTGLDFNLNQPQTEHVSLLYELWDQIHRNQGTLFSHGSFLYTAWLPKDPFLLAGGTAAMLVCLYLGWRDKERNLGFLVAGTLALEIAFYLARGSVILDFYVIPLIPMYALCIALVADRVHKRFARRQRASSCQRSARAWRRCCCCRPADISSPTARRASCSWPTCTTCRRPTCRRNSSPGYASTSRSTTRSSWMTTCG